MRAARVILDEVSGFCGSTHSCFFWENLPAAAFDYICCFITIYHISAFCHQYETKGLFYIVTFLLCVSSTFFLRMSSLKALKHLIP